MSDFKCPQCGEPAQFVWGGKFCPACGYGGTSETLSTHDQVVVQPASPPTGEPDTLREALGLAVLKAALSNEDTAKVMLNIEYALAATADAPEWPFEVRPSVKAVTGADWKVTANDFTPGVFYGPKGACEYVCETLNRLHAKEGCDEA